MHLLKHKKGKETDKGCVVLYLTTMSIHSIENRTILKENHIPDILSGDAKYIR